METRRDNRLWTVIVFFIVANVCWFASGWWYDRSLHDDPLQAWRDHQNHLYVSQLLIFAMLLGWSWRNRYSLVWPIVMFLTGFFCASAFLLEFAASNSWMTETLSTDPEFLFRNRAYFFTVFSVVQISSICFARDRTSSEGNATGKQFAVLNEDIAT